MTQEVYELTDQCNAMIDWGGVQAVNNETLRKPFFAGFFAGRDDCSEKLARALVKLEHWRRTHPARTYSFDSYKNGKFMCKLCYEGGVSLTFSGNGYEVIERILESATIDIDVT